MAFVNEWHRIAENGLITISHSPGQAQEFYVVGKDAAGTNPSTKQYIHIDDFSKSVIVESKRVNKVFENSEVLDATILQKQVLPTHSVQLNISNYDVRLYGMLLVIYDFKTETTLLSRVLYANEFAINSHVTLIDGKFWNYTLHLSVPAINAVRYGVSLIPIQYTDIDRESGPTLGALYHYPRVYDMIPIIDRGVMPDYITCKLTWDKPTQYVTIGIDTAEQHKSIEKSLLDIFELKDAQINIEYLLTWGNDANGWKSMTITNNDNKYRPISLLPDFRPFIGNPVRIIVTMNVRVDGKLLQRQIASDERIIDGIYVLQGIVEKQLNHNIVEVNVSNDIHQDVVVVSPKFEEHFVGLSTSVYAQQVTTENHDIAVSGSERKIKFNISEIESKFNDSTILIVIDEDTNQTVSSLKPIRTSDGVYIFDLNLMIFNDLEKPGKMIYRLFTDNQKQLEGKISIA